MGVRKKIVWMLLLISGGFIPIQAQINTDRVLAIGRNALYFDDYVLSIQYFNQVIRSKPYLAEPYLYRAMAKLSLDDYKGAEDDLNQCIEINPFLYYSYFYRGIARQYQNNFTGAIEDYNKGLRFHPEDKQILVNKGIAYGQDKKYDLAISALDTLIMYQPKFTQAYSILGSIYAEKGDTVKALENFNQALALDKYSAPAYARRGMLYYQQGKYQDALSDYNEAIRLEPKELGYYVNRGLIRYSLNDLRGSMSDYDAVLILDPQNTIGRFNRGLLLSQVGDDKRAVEDFNVVIGNEPDNFMAIYNRAILNNDLHKYKDATSDLDQVLSEYSYFVPGYYFRSEVKRAMGDAKGADKDYWYAYDLEKRLKQEKANGKIITGKGIFDPSDSIKSVTATDTNEKNARERSDKNIEKFNRLVMYDKEDETKSSYKNEIRGRVQDRQVKVDLAPDFAVSYYERPEDIDKTINRFDKTVADYNARMILKMQLKVVNKEAALSDQQAQFHFHSIDDYSLVIEKDSSNADAYFGRALDFMVLQDLSEAVNDFTRAINLRPDFVLAYFDRAVARSKLMQIENQDAGVARNEVQNLSLNIQLNANKSSQQATNSYSQSTVDSNNSFTVDKENRRALEYDQITQDYNKVIQLNPDFVYAYYNRANIRCNQKAYREALADYSEAINRNPEFAEAYYNRGLTRLSLGDAANGIADLSKAGELGIIEAYSIIKKMTADTAQ